MGQCQAQALIDDSWIVYCIKSENHVGQHEPDPTTIKDWKDYAMLWTEPARKQDQASGDSRS